MTRRAQLQRALPRWRRMWRKRQAGRKLREIAASEGVSITAVHKLVEKYASHLLRQRAAQPHSIAPPLHPLSH
jgi:hypothetical protein